jgi:hypothetical protein
LGRIKKFGLTNYICDLLLYAASERITKNKKILAKRLYFFFFDNTRRVTDALLYVCSGKLCTQLLIFFREECSSHDKRMLSEKKKNTLFERIFLSFVIRSEEINSQAQSTALALSLNTPHISVANTVAGRHIATKFHRRP